MRASNRSLVPLLPALLIAAIAVLAAGMPASHAGALPPGDTPAPDVFSRVADAGVAADHAGADYLVVYDYAMNRMKPSGVTYVDSYIIYKVLTPAGCSERSVLRWNYDPQSSYVDVREVNIIRQGERLPVDVANVHDLPAPQSMIYWSDRIKTLQLPRLLVNDGIEVKVFRKGFTYALLDAPAARGGNGTAANDAPDDERYIPPMPGEYFDIVLFPGPAPIIEKKYVLSLPADKRLHSEIYNGPLYASTSYSDEYTEFAWWGFDIPPAPHEPRQPSASDYVTKVVMATAESWEAKSRWFFDVNKDQFEVTPGIKAKVDEIFAAAGVTNASEERKAKALVHWVAQNIRYSGQTMGEGEGFTLHPAQMIFEQRSGVCKDIAGMLIGMMRAAGMDSYAAMTMAGSRIEQVPADQFNHCVCALRKKDGSFEMYDPTWVPFNNDIWSLLETEQHYLIGTPGGEPLAQIRYSPPEESPLRITHNASLTTDGSLTGTIRFEGSGAMDGRLRRLVSSTRKRDLTNLFARIFSPVSDRVRDISCEYHTPDDFGGDMWITVRYRIPQFARRVGGGFEFESPVMRMVKDNVSLFRAAAADWSAERKTDVFLYYTQLLDATEKITLPRGYRSVDTPESKEIEETYASFKGTSAMNGRTLTITHRAAIKRRQIPPDGYGGFKRAVDEAKEWGDTLFRIEKGGRS